MPNCKLLLEDVLKIDNEISVGFVMILTYQGAGCAISSLFTEIARLTNDYCKRRSIIAIIHLKSAD